MLSPEGRFVVTQELPKMPDPIFFVGTKKKKKASAIFICQVCDRLYFYPQIGSGIFFPDK